MCELFQSVISGGYYIPFGNLTPPQLECKAFTSTNLADLTSARQREKFVKDVRVCLCGYGGADEDEEMEENSFSQYQFFSPYRNDIVFFVDKFDYMLCCVAYGVCRVQAGFEHRYMCSVMSALTFKQFTVPASPSFVLDLRQPVTPRTIKDQGGVDDDRIVSYVTRRRSFADGLRSELKALEDEQFDAEKQRGEHPSLMGWEPTDGQPTAGAAASGGAVPASQ